jgi:DNA-binding GntR family transcriptional regulator
MTQVSQNTSAEELDREDLQVRPRRRQGSGKQHAVDTILNDFSTTVASRLVDIVRARILCGAIAPGEPVRQANLAAEFGVSKIPLREALTSLEGEGLLVSVARRGYMVSPLAAAEAIEIFDLRLTLEPLAAVAGARVATDADRDEIKRILGLMNRATRKSDVDAISDLNRAFHMSMFVPTKYPVTGKMMNTLLTLAQRYVHIYLMGAGRDKDAQRNHEDMANAWSAGDLPKTLELVTQHIVETKEELVRALRKSAPKHR